MEVVDWVAARFPDSQWHPEQAVAYYHDLERFDAEDLWAAIYKWYEGRGHEYAPTGSALLYLVKDEQRSRARYAELPAESTGDVVSWSEYAKRRFGRELSWSEAIPLIHAEQCRDESCGCRGGISETG